MKKHVLYLMALGAFTALQAEVADLVIFSYDRPLQLYAFLESAHKHMKGIGKTIVVCRASSAHHYDYGYQLVAEAFPEVEFKFQGANPRADFKLLTLQATFESPSPYVIFAVDDIVMKDAVDLSRCIKLLEDTHAYGFYLRLGKHLDFCYTMNRPQAVPELELVEKDVYKWRFAQAEWDWGYPNTVDMTLYRKKDIEHDFRSMDYTSPNTLEGNWSTRTHQIRTRKGLCFADAKMVNLPLNRVQNDCNNLSMEIKPEELQIKFLQGLKLDIKPLFQIKNRAAHMEYDPTFVERAAVAEPPLLDDADPEQIKKKQEIVEKLGLKSLSDLVDKDIERNPDWYKKISTLEEKRIVIVTASYKNAEWYAWNLDSVFEQNYSNWHLIYVDDCSPDGTGELVKSYVKEKGFEDKVTVICNKNRRKALANLYTAIMMCVPTDIIAILDGDDRFAFDNALKEVNFMYSAYDVWLTYGQFQEYPSGAKGFCKAYPKEVLTYGAFRNCSMGPSHLRTFYAGLFHKIKLEDLAYEGDFFPMTYDLAIMLPMIEMARDHFMFCPTPLVDYNTTNPINDHKVSKELQVRCDEVIRGRGQYRKLEKLF